MSTQPTVNPQLTAEQKKMEKIVQEEARRDQKMLDHAMKDLKVTAKAEAKAEKVRLCVHVDREDKSIIYDLVDVLVGDGQGDTPSRQGREERGEGREGAEQGRAQS